MKGTATSADKPVFPISYGLLPEIFFHTRKRKGLFLPLRVGATAKEER